MPTGGISDLSLPRNLNIPIPEIPELRDYHAADYFRDIIMDELKAFEDELDDDHEVALMLTSFGQSVTLGVTSIGYANPNTLLFYGYVGEQPATLIQNVSQLNFLLLAVKRVDPEKPPRRIGFAVSSED